MTLDAALDAAADVVVAVVVVAAVDIAAMVAAAAAARDPFCGVELLDMDCTTVHLRSKE